MISNILLVIHLLLAVTIIILVILQQGKGSEMGAAFGGGSSQSLFGARGSTNFLSRLTSSSVTLFFITSLALAFIYTRAGEERSIIDSAAIEQVQESAALQGNEVSNNIGMAAEQVPQESDVPATPE